MIDDETLTKLASSSKKCACGGPCEPPPTLGQYEDGTWWWLDETFNYGDDVRYPTREAASEAQMRYCREVLG